MVNEVVTQDGQGALQYFATDGQGIQGNPFTSRTVLGRNNTDLTTTAWGEQLVVNKYSLFRSVFTFEVPVTYKKMINGVEVLDTSADANILSTEGRLKVSSSAGTRYTCRTKRNPRYQPNRSHLYSDSCWVENPGAGTLYIVLRSTYFGVTTDERTEITDLPNDLALGNVWDIQFQWRGAGDFFIYSNLLQRIILEKLGTTTRPTIPNPAMPAMYEAIQGAHVAGGVARSGSAVRWGLGTEENGIFFEWEYEDTRDPALTIGCNDISTEGGQAEALVYGSVNTGRIESTNGEQPSIAMRVPATRIYDGNTVINTRDVQLARISTGQKDESTIRVYATRDPSAINLTAGTWERDFTNSVESIVNDNDDSGKTFTFDNTKAVLLFSTEVELDQPAAFDNPVREKADFYITPGDHIIVTHQTAGTDIVNVTIEFGADL